jgi:hypothetical protein
MSPVLTATACYLFALSIAVIVTGAFGACHYVTQDVAVYPLGSCEAPCCTHSFLERVATDFPDDCWDAGEGPL